MVAVASVKGMKTGQTVTIKIGQWFAMNNGLISRSWVGQAKVLTDRAILFVGSVDVRESQFCHRCSREIVNPVSILVGYGTICSDYLGIPRP